jgi:cell division protein ZapA (FtsZ GTPase activity inhibitor)
MAAGIGNGAATAVTIFGQTYRLRGVEDDAYLTELAGIVDRRMREIVESTGTTDSLRVAILAALNIADDYLQASRDPSVPEDGTEERLARMAARLGDALAG